MRHTVLISAHPECGDLYQNALTYCRSLIDGGNQLKQVFFMHDATLMATHSDAQQWSDFAIEQKVDLQTCVSTAEQKALCLHDYAEGFAQGGLSTLADSILSSDVVVQINEDFDPNQGYESLAFKDSKKISFIFPSEPKEASIAAEGIDLLLVLSAFDAEISVVFSGNGIKNIQEDDQNPRYVKRFKALPDFDVTQCFILDESDGDSIASSCSSQSLLACQSISKLEFESLKQHSHVLIF